MHVPHGTKFHELSNAGTDRLITISFDGYKRFFEPDVRFEGSSFCQ